jgi:hypothetical protein
MGILGPCAMTGAVEVIQAEGDRLTQTTRDTKGLYAVHRLPTWKPRTLSTDWHGMETTDPEGAYATIIRQANRGDAVAIEVSQPYHLERYGHALSMAWIGARQRNTRFMEWVAEEYPDLPLAIKNGLDGEIEPTLEIVSRLQEIRGEDGAAVVLLYRGGENAKTPETWEEQYRKALHLTNGRMVADNAHGTEQAFYAQKGAFKKSEEGQEAAMRRIIAIAEQEGLTPASIMAEASSAWSPTDPHMSFTIALDGIRRLHALRSSAKAAALAHHN